ncbi:MAG TPA: PA domain-containing protein [Thermoanaerobaculia bacterium]|nr:PA domain-containing protein [Thermoanaerobaculia bacterium]
MRFRGLLLFSLLAFAATNVFAGSGRMVIISVDGAGVGFNDPTPATPVGGNLATTRGAQRMNVIQLAAARWTAVLDTNVDIRVRASWATLECDDSSAVLAGANSVTWSYNFTGAPRQEIWYPAALANKFAGRDLTANQDDISITFNSALDLPTCRGDRSWYYGLDVNEGQDDSMLTVAMHEIGHGLGMAGRGVDWFQNRPTIYDVHTLDVTAGRSWDQMSVEQRRVSATNTGKVVWTGPNVTAKAPQMLERPPVLTVTGKNYDVGAASFGPTLNSASMNGAVVSAHDAENTEGPTALDGCTAYDNASAVAGKVALVDRGTCTFVQKALMAQAAGATGLVIVDNRKEANCVNNPPGMSGNEPQIRIPVMSVTQDDGNELRAKADAAFTNALLRLDPSRLSGMTDGYVRLYAPCAFSAGSSLYHWDTAATPNLLMEPFINGDLLDSVDLTLYQMLDIGWTQPPRTGRRVLRR